MDKSGISHTLYYQIYCFEKDSNVFLRSDEILSPSFWRTESEEETLLRQILFGLKLE